MLCISDRVCTSLVRCSTLSFIEIRVVFFWNCKVPGLLYKLANKRLRGGELHMVFVHLVSWRQCSFDIVKENTFFVWQFFLKLPGL
jgi:hypothetical protein